MCILAFSSPMVSSVTHTHTQNCTVVWRCWNICIMLYGQFMTQQFSKSGAHECSCFFIGAEVHSNKVSCSFLGQQKDQSRLPWRRALRKLPATRSGCQVPCNAIFSLVDNGICAECWAPCRAMVACRWALVSRGLWILVKMVAMPAQEMAASLGGGRTACHLPLWHSRGAKHSPNTSSYCQRACFVLWQPHPHSQGVSDFRHFCTCHTTLCPVQPRDPCECPLPWYNEWEHHLSDWEDEGTRPIGQRWGQLFFWALHGCRPVCLLGKCDAEVSRTLPLWWTIGVVWLHPWAHLPPGCHSQHKPGSSSLQAWHHCSGHGMFGSPLLWQRISSLPNQFSRGSDHPGTHLHGCSLPYAGNCPRTSPDAIQEEWEGPSAKHGSSPWQASWWWSQVFCRHLATPRAWRQSSWIADRAKAIVFQQGMASESMYVKETLSPTGRQPCPLPCFAPWCALLPRCKSHFQCSSSWPFWPKPKPASTPHSFTVCKGSENVTHSVSIGSYPRARANSASRIRIVAFFSSSSLSAFSKSLVTSCNAVKMFSKSACKAAIFWSFFSTSACATTNLEETWRKSSLFCRSTSSAGFGDTFLGSVSEDDESDDESDDVWPSAAGPSWRPSSNAKSGCFFCNPFCSKLCNLPSQFWFQSPLIPVRRYRLRWMVFSILVTCLTSISLRCGWQTTSPAFILRRPPDWRRDWTGRIGRIRDWIEVDQSTTLTDLDRAGNGKRSSCHGWEHKGEQLLEPDILAAKVWWQSFGLGGLIWYARVHVPLCGILLAGMINHSDVTLVRRSTRTSLVVRY